MQDRSIRLPSLPRSLHVPGRLALVAVAAFSVPRARAEVPSPGEPPQPGAHAVEIAQPGTAQAGAELGPPGRDAPRALRATPAELEAFFDGLMSAHLAEKGVAGATLAVVRGGEVLLTKGYGYADVERGVPVDPERTLFRIGSVSKLFTWTAVMQLVEEGRLDLDADVNGYLDFEVPDTYPEPVTMRHLMTHTPGFEDDMRDVFTTDPDAVRALGPWLAEAMPTRVRPPGTFAAYSNYGTALAGHVVERLSGMSWEDYVEQRILEPLGMRQTSVRQPLPEALAADMSRGYTRRGDRLEAQPWEFLTAMAPAGAMSASAADMARFMLAHLALGELDGARILKTGTAREMQRVHFTHDPRLPGMCLGFYEKSRDPRVIGHDGGTAWFHTLLVLFPEHDLGLFVSYNTDTASALPFGAFLSPFLDAFLGPPAPAERVQSGPPASGIAGNYRLNRLSYTTFQKLMGLAMTTGVTVEDGVLVAPTPFGTLRMVEVEPGLFREERGRQLVAVRTDPDGRATHAFASAMPMMVLERVPWHAAPGLHLVLLGGGLLMFAVLLLAAPIRWLLRRRRGETQTRSRIWARRALLLAATLNLGFVVAVLAQAGNPFDMLTRPMTGLKVALAFPVLGALATLAAAIATGALFKGRAGTRWTRARYGAAVLLALLFVWSLGYWNLLGWQL